MKSRALALAFLLLVSIVNVSAAALLPEPQEVRTGEGEFNLQDAVVYYHSPDQAAEARRIAEYFGIQSLLSEPETGKNSIELLGADHPGLTVEFPTKHAQDAYVLDISPERICIYAAANSGFFYAGVTLRQWADQMQARSALIRDWPDLELRGITDDMSRGQVSTLQNMKDIVRFLADYKMNVYMPYIEDIFTFRSYPAIGKNRGAISRDEFIQLQDFAENYHVQIIPIFQTLGHYENILSQPEFIHLAEYPGAASLNIANEEIYEFLENVLAEVVPVFKSKYFHIGADESWDVGKYATRGLADRIGVASLHAQHYRRVFDLLAKYDKTIMMYGDIILNNPTILNEIPSDIIMFDWHYYPKSNYDSPEKFNKYNQPFLVSAGVHNWRRVFPNLSDALANIRQLTVDGIANGAIGSITSNWGDYGAFNLRELNYYPYAVSGAISWNSSATDPIAAEKSFMQTFYGTDDPDLQAVYRLLDYMGDQIEYLKLFGHPFHTMSEKEIEKIRQANNLPGDAAYVLAAIGSLKSQATRNRDQLDFLAYCAKIFDWYGQLAALQIETIQAGNMIPSSPQREETGKRLAVSANKLAANLDILRQEYDALWQRTNRLDNLWMVDELFSRLAKTLRIKADEFANNNFAFNGTLSSEFISAENAGEEGASIPKVYLRKTFMLDKKVTEAKLQLIADSHARLFINSKEIGEVFARKTLSALVERQRVATFDLSKSLKKGKNIIAIEVTNYIPGRIAAANVWLQVKTDNEWQAPVVSNNYWKASNIFEDGWFRAEYQDNQWPNAALTPNSWPISRPYFEYGLSGRIEFFWK